MTTITNGKFNSRAVAAMQLDTVRSCRAHCVGKLAGVLYQPSHEKMMMRQSIERAKMARVQAGIYKAGDFHRAVLV